MEFKVLSGPSSRPCSGPVLLPGTLFTTVERADMPGKAELTTTGSNQANRTEQDASASERPSPQTICVSEAADQDLFSKFNSGLHPDLDMDKASLQHSRLPDKSQTSVTSSADQPAQNPPEMVQSCLAQSLAHVVPVVPQTAESLCHKNRTKCTEFAFLPQDCSTGEENPDSEKLKEPPVETNDKTSTDFLYRDCPMTTAATTSLISEGLTSSLTADPDIFIDLHEGPHPKTSTGTSGLSAPQSSSFNEQTHLSFTQSQEDHPRERKISPHHTQQSPTSLQDPVPLEPNIVSIMSCSEIHPSTLTCDQKSVHDLSMISSSPTPSSTTVTPPILAQRSHLHDHSNPFPPPLLTTDVCQPVAVREEIRLTPQIKGPPVLVQSPVGQTQIRPQPQGRGLRVAQPCWTRPLSRAAVMEGSPVFLEVEVTPQPKPTVTWWVAYNELHNNTQI